MSMSMLLWAAESVECPNPCRRIPVSFLLSDTTTSTEPSEPSGDTQGSSERSAHSSERHQLSRSSSISSFDRPEACSKQDPRRRQTAMPSTQSACRCTSSSEVTLESLPPTSPATPPQRVQPQPFHLFSRISSPIRKPRQSQSAATSVSPSCSTGVAPRRRWNAREDALLTAVVSACGAARWNEIATRFPGRNGRQVRLRWMNHLQPSLDRAPWRAEEDEMLLQRQRALGNRWSAIAASLGGRTDNSVKNRFKSLQRKAARERRADLAAKMVAVQREAP